MAGRKGRVLSLKKTPIPHMAYQVRYDFDGLFYFCHAKTWSKARWTVIRRHKRAFGFIGLLVQRVYELDNVPITIPTLEKLGYKLARGDKNAPICTCDLCVGGKNAEKT